MNADMIDEKQAMSEILDEKRAIVVDFLNEKQPFVIEEKAEIPAWVPERDAAVTKAVAARDDAELARLSALPGGFGSNASRKKAWFELLHADNLTGLRNASRDTTPETDTEGIQVNAPHEDENQVLLDTRRSFVTYPRGLSKPGKAAMQEDLQNLIVTVLQRHPRLSYFQGFHDIMTVLYLSLLSDTPRRRGDKFSPEERAEWAELVRASEIVALCRTRDAMGKGLAPMMGMLKLLRRVLAAADPQLYNVSASISPVPTLPFFALSWILTLFSHDVDTLEPVQRIFDYLIARNPIFCIYLAVAILIAKKPQMARLIAQMGSEARHDPSLLHPLFARLPPLYPDTPDSPTPPPSYRPPPLAPHDEPNPYTPIPLSTVFALADKLMAKYPYDGKKIRAYEVFGSGSTVRTYAKEKAVDAEWTLADAENAIDKDVILPNGDEPDEEESLVPAPRFAPRCDRLGTAVAVGVVVVGVGAVLLGWRGSRADPQWIRFWGLVATSWSSRSRETVRSWAAVANYFTRTLREAL